MENTLIKRLLAAAGLLLFVFVLLAVPVLLYVDAHYRTVLDARNLQAELIDAQPTYFDLFAEEEAHQTKARISGWMNMVAAKEVVTQSPRGKLSATLYEPLDGAANAPVAIVLHGGLGTDREQVQDIACTLSLNGYRVLTPDLYAHGKSVGDAPTLGFGDAADVQAWVDFVEKMQMGAKIVLFGQDEGAAAVLLAACGKLSDSVKAVAADSAADLGTQRMLELAQVQEDSLMGKLLKTVYLRRASGADNKISGRIASARIPLLLIHGTGDQDVPAWQSEDIALAAGEHAQLLYVEGAGHGLSRYVDPEMYYDSLLLFYESALK